MRWLALTIFVVIPLAALPARAQSSGTGTAGTCTGDMTGNVGIAVTRNDKRLTVNSSYLNAVFGDAECLCDDPSTSANDLELEIQVTMPLPLTDNGASLEVWIGNGCDSYATRTQPLQTACEKLATNLSAQTFLTNVATSTTLIHMPINGSALSTPVTHTCGGAVQARSIYIFVYTDPMSPLATCTFNTNYNGTGPDAAVNPAASPGDEAVTLTWTPPSATTLPTLYYQIMCATADGQVVPGKKPADQAYSVCLPNGDYVPRTTLPVGGTTLTNADGGTTTDDGGTTSNPDFTFGSAKYKPQGVGDDLGTTDDADTTDDLTDTTIDLTGTTGDLTNTSADLITGDLTPISPSTGYRGVTTTSLHAPFTNLDPAYLCSGPITAQGLNYNSRLTGLVNHTDYQFVILAVDSYGNVTPSAVLDATPAPVEDFYRRYRDEGGKASGFCFIATAAFGSYENRWVHVLREFRDEVLLPTSSGRSFVTWYYDHSPPAADYISQHKAARVLTQMILWPVIGFAAFVLYIPQPLGFVLLLAALSLVFRRRIEAWWVRA